MTTDLRIYADFNGLLEGLEPGHDAVRLESFGSLRDLNALRARLFDGMRLTLWSDSGPEETMEAQARVFWCPDTRKQRGGHWLADIDPDTIRYLPQPPELADFKWFPCGHCGANLAENLDHTQIPPVDACPDCGTPTGQAFAPPDGQPV